LEGTENVRPLPERLPDSIEVSQNPDLRMTPNQVRALKAETGKTLGELMGEEEGGDDADRLQVIVWLELRRRGIEVRWDQCGDVAIEFKEEAVDPTNGEPSTSSPPSAASGA
jgi:hypothetical protein